MNKRIRKKRDKKITEAINGLVLIAERREQQRQAAIRQFVKRCEALYEQQRTERRNWRSNKEKDNLHDTRPYKNSYRPHWQLNTAARQTFRQRGDLWPRQLSKTDRRFLCPFSGSRKAAERSFIMAFFNSAVGVLQTLVIALGAGLGIWGVMNLLEGYGNDNPGANAHVR